MARLVFDASVVIALLDERDGDHGRAVDLAERTQGDEKFIPASAFAEVLVVPYRVSPARAGELERTLDEVPLKVAPLTADIARVAASLRAHHPALRLGDALVVATGEVLGATVLTADRAWTRYSSRVKVI